jgi:transposase-like protein
MIKPSNGQESATTPTVSPRGPPPPPVASSAPLAAKRVAQDVEVVPKPRRRTFAVKYKREVVKKADECKGDGDIGALLRKEGLYSSQLTTWRREVEERDLVALAPRKRGPKPKATEVDRDNVRLRRELAQWRVRAERAELVLEIEKKVSLLLGQKPSDDEGRA